MKSRKIKPSIGLVIREIRQKQNLTQLAFSIKGGFDRSFISDVERGRKDISVRFLTDFALALNMRPSELHWRWENHQDNPLRDTIAKVGSRA